MFWTGIPDVRGKNATGGAEIETMFLRSVVMHQNSECSLPLCYSLLLIKVVYFNVYTVCTRFFPFPKDELMDFLPSVNYH